MKSYKDYPKKHIGVSDISALVLRSPDGVAELNFGADGSYSAYICDGVVEIGEKYELRYEAKGWLWIYDDTGITEKINANCIRVYRAGDMGCVIQVLHWKGE